MISNGICSLATESESSNPRVVRRLALHWAVWYHTDIVVDVISHLMYLNLKTIKKLERIVND